jgi:hypothetical protein
MCGFHPRTRHEGPAGQKKYSGAFSLPPAQYGGGGCLAPHPDRFTSEKETSYPRTGGWVGSRNGLDGCRKLYPSPEFDLRTVQPVMSRYTENV